MFIQGGRNNKYYFKKERSDRKIKNEMTKKLRKRKNNELNTIEMYGNSCSCYCNAAYCAANWKAMNDYLAKNNFSKQYEYTN